MKEASRPFTFLYIIGFLFSVQYGLVIYINSSFLAEVVGGKLVGIIFTVAALVSVVYLFEFSRVLSRLGNYQTAILSVCTTTIGLILLASVPNIYAVIPAFFIYTIANYSLILVLDVFLEEYTPPKSTGRIRGVSLTSRNLGLLLGPGIAVWLVNNASYVGVYLGAALMTALSFFLIIPRFKNFRDPVYHRISVRSTLQKVRGDSELIRIYGSQLLLCIFYSWMIIYMPLYLRETIGLGWTPIGVIFTIMLIPFIIVDYPLGRLSDKIGEKKLLLVGFLVMVIATASIFFITTNSVIVWALILFMTRVGAAIIEVMNEAYFFKKVAPDDAGLISFFRNLFPIAFIAGPLVATLLLFIIPSLTYLFLILGIGLIFGLILTSRLRDIK